VIPLAGVADAVLEHVPLDVKITVTVSPRLGQEATLDLAERLAAHGFDVVPHLSARLVRDEAQLRELVDRIDEMGVRDLFVVAPFITLPAVITRDPRTGTRNVGMYRMQVIDRQSTFMHWQTHKDGRMDWLASDGKLEVAVALGLDPVTAYSASAPLPKHIDELQLAGFLRGEPVELVEGKTVALEVPANAEIVLEGYVVAGETGTEGPFGDHTGYYSPAEQFPIFHVTAMTMRADAIYPSIVVGKPPAEDA
jgi:UbiD family decarboxylase